jgi:quinol monooxygenase YgiN
MVIALGDIYVQIPRRSAVAELMRSTQARVRQEPGCLGYAFAETVDDPGHFVLMQRWADRAAFDAHYRSEAFAEYQAQIGQHLTRTSDLNVYEVESSARPFDSAGLDPAGE